MNYAKTLSVAAVATLLALGGPVLAQSGGGTGSDTGGSGGPSSGGSGSTGGGDQSGTSSGTNSGSRNTDAGKNDSAGGAMKNTTKPNCPTGQTC